MHKLGMLLLLGFSAFILWIIYLANTGQHSIFFDLVKAIPYGDKIGHFMLFGILTLIANLATKFRTFTIGKINIFIGSALVLAFVSIEELSQYFMPSRTLDIYDYTANIIGIAAFSLISSIISRRNSTRG